MNLNLLNTAIRSKSVEENGKWIEEIYKEKERRARSVEVI